MGTVFLPLFPGRINHLLGMIYVRTVFFEVWEEDTKKTPKREEKDENKKVTRQVVKNLLLYTILLSSLSFIGWSTRRKHTYIKVGPVFVYFMNMGAFF
jgi:hypothetical protein